MMLFEEAIKKADEELDRIAYNAECNKMDWFAVIVYLAKKGLQAEKGGAE